MTAKRWWSLTTGCPESAATQLPPSYGHGSTRVRCNRTEVALHAPLTTDPLEWASDPGGKDFPGVDTGPTFRDEQGAGFDTDSFVEETVGINDAEDNLSDLGIDI